MDRSKSIVLHMLKLASDDHIEHAKGFCEDALKELKELETGYDIPSSEKKVITQIMNEFIENIRTGQKKSARAKAGRLIDGYKPIVENLKQVGLVELYAIYYYSAIFLKI